MSRSLSRPPPLRRSLLRDLDAPSIFFDLVRARLRDDSLSRPSRSSPSRPRLRLRRLLRSLSSPRASPMTKPEPRPRRAPSAALRSGSSGTSNWQARSARTDRAPTDQSIREPSVNPRARTLRPRAAVRDARTHLRLAEPRALRSTRRRTRTPRRSDPSTAPGETHAGRNCGSPPPGRRRRWRVPRDATRRRWRRTT